MGKARRGDKEYSKEQKLLKENKQLKQDVARLRKELARIDLDRYSSVKEMIDEHYQENRAQEGQDILAHLKKEWKCRECPAGTLEIILYNKINATWYYRSCNECPNRTKSQKYNDSVKGIVKKS